MRVVHEVAAIAASTGTHLCGIAQSNNNTAMASHASHWCWPHRCDAPHLHVNTRRGIGQQLCTAFASLAAPALDQRSARASTRAATRGSIWTAKPLEWIRIKRQLDADESLQELADPNLRDSPGQRLSKVLRLEDAIRAMGPLLATADGRSLAAAALASPAFETKAIKKAFTRCSGQCVLREGRLRPGEPVPAGRYTTKLEVQMIQYMNRRRSNDALDQVRLL